MGRVRSNFCGTDHVADLRREPVLLLVNDGDPELLKAMGVDGIVLGHSPGVHGDEVGTVVNRDNLPVFIQQAERARDCGLVCQSIYPDWNLVEKTIDDPSYVDQVLALCDELASHGLIDLFVSCGLRNVESLSHEERQIYEKRFVANLTRIYEHAEPLGLHVCLHASLMPWIFLRDVAAWDRWHERIPLKSNAMILCLGCVASAGISATERVERWHSRVRAVHVRNVQGNFADRSHRDMRVDCGILELPPVFVKLKEIGFQGSIIPEHFPDFPGDQGFQSSKAFALGYCRALMQS